MSLSNRLLSAFVRVVLWGAFLVVLFSLGGMAASVVKDWGTDNTLVMTGMFSILFSWALFVGYFFRNGIDQMIGRKPLKLVESMEQRKQKRKQA